MQGHRGRWYKRPSFLTSRLIPLSWHHLCQLPRVPGTVLAGTKQAKPDPIRIRGNQACRDKLLTIQSRIFVVMMSTHQKALRPTVRALASNALTQCQVRGLERGGQFINSAYEASSWSHTGK